MTTLLTPISEQLPPNVDQDVEPDAQWKESLRARIEQTLRPMVDKAREDRDVQLRGLLEGTAQWENVMRAYNQAMDRVRRLAQEQFTEELKIARFERSLALGKEVEGDEFEDFKRRQQAIWDTIKRGSSERQQGPEGRRDSTISNPNQENGKPVAVPPKANGEPAASPPGADGEQDAREGPSIPHRDSRPLARPPPGSDPRPRDRTQSGGSDQILGTPGSYGARPARSRGNSSVFADFDPTTPSASPPYGGGASSLSKTRPQDIWLPRTPPKDDLPSTSTSRTYAHATVSPLGPSGREGIVNDNGRTLSRASSIRSSIRSPERPSPLDFDLSSLPRDRYALPVEERNSSRKGKEPERPERPERSRQPSFTQQTSVHDIYAPRRSDSRMQSSRPGLAPQGLEDQQFPQVSPQNTRFRMAGPDDEGIPIRLKRRSHTSDQASPETMRYGSQNPASARPIPPRRSLTGDADAWPAQPSPYPLYGPQSPPSIPTASSSRPIPRRSSTDDDLRRHSPSRAWNGSHSPPNAPPSAGYDFSSSPRYRSPASSVSGRRNSNGSRSVRSRSSRQEFWGPSDVSQRPLATFEEQSVASDSDSEEDYGEDLDDLWQMRERAEVHDRQELTWKLVRDEQRRQERLEVMRKTEEAKRLEEEARRKAEEARRKEEEAQRKEEEARRKADEARRKEEEVRLKALEIQQKQEELARREAELLRREVEAKLQEEIRKREDAEAKLQQWQEAEERRKQEDADRLERERQDKEEREKREQEERKRRDQEDRERRAKEDKERREKERREKAERERRDREERERRAEEERERRDKEKRDREERERLEQEEKAKREREEVDRREREEAQRREWQRQQREQEERFAREREAWEEARRRDTEAVAAAAAQARLEAERLQVERLAALEAHRQREDAARRQREAETQRLREQAEHRKAEAQRQQELEEQQQREAEQREAEEQQRKAVEEERQREEEERQREKEERQREKEERQREEEELQRQREERQRAEEEERQRQQEEQRQKDDEERRRQREAEERWEKAMEAARKQREAAETAQRQREAEEARQREAAEARQREADVARVRDAEAERARAEATQSRPTNDIAQFQDPQFIREQEAELARIQRQRDEREARERAARQREEEEARKQEAAKTLEEENRRTAAFVREQEEAYKRAQLENDGRLRELEARRRAEEALRRKEDQQRQQSEAVYQEALRRSEEEWRMQQERRRRQDSVGSVSDSSSARPVPQYSSASSSAPRPIPTPGDRSSSASSSSFSSSASYFSASSGRSNSTGYTSSASRTSATPSATPTGMPGTPNSRGGWKSPISPATPQPTTATSTASSRPTAGAYQTASSYAHSSSSTPRATSSHTSNTAFNEEEWARRQEEHARRQFEQFQREQEAQQRRSEQKAMRQLSKEDVIRLFEDHDRRWTRIPTLEILSWHSFPWPMLKQPNDPEQLTYIEIQAYVLSPHQSSDKTPRERIKDYLRKWHPDRFETKLLPKVREDDREKVKEGAGTVTRHLNKLLGSLSGSAENGLFG